VCDVQPLTCTPAREFRQQRGAHGAYASDDAQHRWVPALSAAGRSSPSAAAPDARTGRAMTRSTRKSEVLPSVARSAETLFTPARRSERRRFRPPAWRGHRRPGAANRAGHRLITRAVTRRAGGVPSSCTTTRVGPRRSRSERSHRHGPQRRGHRQDVRHARPDQGPARAGQVPVPRHQPLDRRRPQPLDDQGLLRRRQRRRHSQRGVRDRRGRAGHPARHRHRRQPGRVPAARARRLPDDLDRLRRRGAQGRAHAEIGIHPTDASNWFDVLFSG
jgi:hypothetical protein